MKPSLITLSGKYMHNWVVTKLLPKITKARIKEICQLLWMWKQADKEFKGTAEWTDTDIGAVKVMTLQLLKESHLKAVYIETVYGWMRLLGFKYETRKKTLLRRHTQQARGRQGPR